MRDRICEAAMALFARGGVDGISMREVARELGASTMMPYKYFPSKDHILQELRTRSFQKLETALRHAINAHAEPSAALEATFLTYLRFGRDEPEAYRLMFDYWAYDDDKGMFATFGDAARRQSGAWDAMLLAIERHFLAQGVSGEASTAAHLAWASLHGLVSLEAARKLVFGKRLDDLMQPMVEAIMRSLPQAAASEGRPAPPD